MRGFSRKAKLLVGLFAATAIWGGVAPNLGAQNATQVSEPVSVAASDPQFGPKPTAPLTSPGGPEALDLSQPTGDFSGAPESISELGGVDDEPQLPWEMAKIRPDGGAIERPNADGSKGKGRGKNGARKDWIRGRAVSATPTKSGNSSDGGLSCCVGSWFAGTESEPAVEVAVSGPEARLRVFG